MSGIRSLRRGATVLGNATAGSAPIYVDSDDNKLKMIPAGTGITEVDVVDVSSTQTLTNKTLTSPVETAPAVSGAAAFTGTTITGIPIVKRAVLTESAVGTTKTVTVPIPAGATILDLYVIPRVLWNGTSASLKVGDSADDDGFFTATDLKATDLLVGEMLSVLDGDLWGGVNGAYLVAATGQRGPTSSNFGLTYVAGSNITFIVTQGAADGSAGRTECVVVYAVGETIAQT